MSRDRKKISELPKAETAADSDVEGGIGTAEFEAYLAHLAHLDISLPMKIELIRALRHILQSFVDRAFGDDPTQLARGAKCDPENSDTPLGPGMLQSENGTQQESALLTGCFRHCAVVPVQKVIEE